MGSKNPKLEDLNLDLGAIRRYEIDLSRGILKADGEADHRRLLEAIEKIGPWGLPKDPPRRAAAEAPPSATLKSEMLSSVAEKWLAERRQKNGARTVYMKELHYKDFQRRIAKDVEIDSITKAVMVGYKSACLAAGQKAKTIDNKLLSISDLFKYALAHGLYNASPVSPVSGLFMQTKSERLAKAESYKPFTDSDIKAIFEAEAYKAGMAEPEQDFSATGQNDVPKYVAALDHARDNRQFEIELYWKRATYFWGLITATFAGYFAILSSGTAIVERDFLAFILACIGCVLTFAWFMVDKGSKQWQANWEAHVDMLEDKVTGPSTRRCCVPKARISSREF